MTEIRKKVYFKLVAEITAIGELVHIKREGLSDIYKKVVTLVTSDGQKLYPEIRNKKLTQLNVLNIHDIVDLEYTFEGSQKGDKLYNNIYINKIIKYEKEIK